LLLSLNIFNVENLDVFRFPVLNDAPPLFAIESLTWAM